MYFLLLLSSALVVALLIGSMRARRERARILDRIAKQLEDQSRSMRELQGACDALLMSGSDTQSEEVVVVGRRKADRLSGRWYMLQLSEEGLTPGHKKEFGAFFAAEVGATDRGFVSDEGIWVGVANGTRH
jgi:hypothetical protein